MSLTVSQAAKAARCTDTTIYQMIKANHLKAEAVDEGRNKWRIFNTRDEVKALVQKHHPRSGFRKNAPAKGGKTDLRTLLALAAVPTNKRAVLLKLAAKFTLQELELLLSL